MHMGRVPDGWDAIEFLESIGLGPVKQNCYGQMVLTVAQNDAVTNKLQSVRCKVCKAAKGEPCRDGTAPKTRLSGFGRSLMAGDGE